MPILRVCGEWPKYRRLPDRSQGTQERVALGTVLGDGGEERPAFLRDVSWTTRLDGGLPALDQAASSARGRLGDRALRQREPLHELADRRGLVAFGAF
jgi:hypothetical protein